jgi:nucleoside-diphosphate-sugar epimerase
VKILLTGGSSFTGTWFVHALADAGHQVVATFRRDPREYPDALRRRRAALVIERCRPVFGVSFGDEAFLRLVREGGWDLLAHHAADVTNYKSPDFDVAAALQSNTRELRAVLAALAEGGGRRVLLTGSIFEQGEGAGSDDLPAFSPYGLSKGLTAASFAYHCRAAGLHLGKFVIPNPFGPLEEPRFTHYLVQTWLAGKRASCATPAYVRDNVHVSLLARAYAQFAERLPAAPGTSRLNPSGYAESQGAFTRRFAEEMRPRLGVPCEVELKRQEAFPEPRVRINTDVLDAAALGWDERAAWDEYARHCLSAQDGATSAEAPRR